MRKAERNMKTSGLRRSRSTVSVLKFEDHWTGEERLAHATSAGGLQNLVKYTKTVVNADIRKVGVDKLQLMRVILDDELQRKTCIMFPLIILYFSLFAAVFQVHYGVSYINLQESQLRTAFAEKATTVNTASDIFNWMEADLLPYLWSCPNVDGNGGSRSGSFASAEQELVVGVTLRTSRGPSRECTGQLLGQQGCLPESPNIRSNDPVFNGWDSDSRRLAAVRGQRRGAAARRLDVAKAHLKDSIPAALDAANAYSYVIPMSMTLEQATETLATWKQPDRLLITNATTMFGVSFMLRNSELDNGILSSVYISFLFSRGGQVYTEVLFESTVMRTRPIVLGAIIIWAILLVCFTVLDSVHILAALKQGDCCAYFLHFENLFEWSLLTLGWFIVAMLTAERLGMNKFNEQWDEYQSFRATADQTTIQDFDRSWLSKMESNVRMTGALDGYAQMLVSFYHIALLFRFLIASRGHPRLAVVVNTLQRGFDDLVHLFIVFVIIFISFVMAGHILFGHRMSDFSSVKGSLSYCVQIVLQREYEGDRITEEDPVTATIWIWSFVVLVVLVVVNIVLAMIFDNYGQVRMLVTDKDTVWHAARYLFMQLRNLSTWVSNHNLMVALHGTGSAPVNVLGLQQLCPGIPQQQIDHLFDTAKLRLVTSVLHGNKNIMPEAIASILLSVEDLRYGVEIMAGPAPGRQAGQSYASTKSKTWSSTGSFYSRQATEMGDSAQPSPETPPDDVPTWVKDGLLVHLKKRQTAMDHLYLQMQQIQGELHKRGIGKGSVNIPLPEPEQPSREGSTRLGPSTTGRNMQPVITPGKGRTRSVVRRPRETTVPTGRSIVQRLGRC